MSEPWMARFAPKYCSACGKEITAEAPGILSASAFVHADGCGSASEITTNSKLAELKRLRELVEKK